MIQYDVPTNISLEDRVKLKDKRNYLADLSATNVSQPVVWFVFDCAGGTDEVMLEGGSLVSAETPFFIKEPDLLLQLPSEKLYFLFNVL